MMRCNTLILTVAMAILASSPAAYGQSASEMLEKGIFIEQTVGDLDAAIEIYQKIVRDAEANRAHAAHAQYRLGLCFLKQGKKDQAATAFRTLIDLFPAQAEMTGNARAQLSKLGRATSTVTTRQVWAPIPDVSGAVSPDGRYVSYVNWTNGNLAFHDVKTGEDRDLTDEGTWETPQQFSDASIWSPDSRQIAYCWIDRGGGKDLRIVGLDGGKPRILHHDPELGFAWPRAWSHDGKHILAIFCRKGGPENSEYQNKIVLVSVADGTMRDLKWLGNRNCQYMGLSPDDRYVVYGIETEEGSGTHDIYVLDVETGRETPLVEHPANDGAPVWTPDGKGIVFVSNRSGARSLWMQEVDDGRPKGAATPIREMGRGFRVMGFGRDGSFYYIVGALKLDVYVATVDFEAGEVLSSPTKVSLRYEGSNYAPSWSPDGKYLAFSSRRKTERVLVIRSVETGEERDLLPKSSMLMMQPRSDATPRWSPDGSSILVNAIDVDRKDVRTICLVDVETGDVTPIVRGGDPEKEDDESTGPRWSAFSSDGRQVYYVHGESIMVHDLETRRKRELYRSDTHLCRLAVSPDGRQLAFMEGALVLQPSVVKTMPASGGVPGELYTLKEGDTFSWLLGLRWTPDGRNVVVGMPQPEGEPAELWSIPVTGGKPRTLNLGFNVRHLVLHPDGNRIAMTRQEPKSGSELWAMENFLPEPNAAE